MFRLRKIRNLEERLCRVGLGISGGVHAALIAAIIGCTILGIEIPLIEAMTGKAKAIVRAEYWERNEFADVTKIVDDELRRLIQPNNEKKATDSRLTLSPAGVPQVVDTANTPTTEAVSLGEFVKARADRATEEADKVDTDTKLAQLEKRSKDLRKLATEESLNELSNKFQKWFGSDKRAEKPTEKPVTGRFDDDTAQLHDVRREGSEKEGYKYTSILVDAAGRTFEAPMSQKDGESAYRTMQLIKSNPLLEQVYRGIVMGMLDKIMKPDDGKK